MLSYYNYIDNIKDECNVGLFCRLTPVSLILDIIFIIFQPLFIYMYIKYERR